MGPYGYITVTVTLTKSNIEGIITNKRHPTSLLQLSAPITLYRSE